MELYFEKRALIAGAVAGIFAVVGLIALHSEGHYVYHRLLHQGLPVVIVSAVCGLAALAALLLGNRLLLRPLAALAVVAVIWGAFTAMFPYLLPTSMTISEAAAPNATLSAVFVVFGIAVVLVLPRALPALFPGRRSDIASTRALRPSKRPRVRTARPGFSVPRRWPTRSKLCSGTSTGRC